MSDTVIFRQHGDPLGVLEVTSEGLQPPGEGEVLVTQICAPINPADLNTIEGKYPMRPELPGTPGVEGVGVIAELGTGVTGLAVGSLVILPHGFGSWRDAGVLAAERLIPVVPGVSKVEAAMLKINPATAWRMLHDFVSLKPGEWVIQNAANSAVGRHVIALAHELGLKTVNLVRRVELVDELKRHGADIVLVDDENVLERVKTETSAAPIRLGLNAVGGESATRLANALAPSGVLVTYGAMSRQNVKVPNGLLIFKDIQFRGFWVSQWYKTATAAEVRAMFALLFDFVRRGVIQTPVERIYSVAEVHAAVRHAMQSGRSGKILLGAG